jgi:hypothetical protein
VAQPREEPRFPREVREGPPPGGRKTFRKEGGIKELADVKSEAVTTGAKIKRLFQLSTERMAKTQSNVPVTLPHSTSSTYQSLASPAHRRMVSMVEVQM